MLRGLAAIWVLIWLCDHLPILKATPLNSVLVCCKRNTPVCMLYSCSWLSSLETRTCHLRLVKHFKATTEIGVIHSPFYSPINKQTRCPSILKMERRYSPKGPTPLFFRVLLLFFLAMLASYFATSWTHPTVELIWDFVTKSWARRVNALQAVCVGITDIVNALQSLARYVITAWCTKLKGQLQVLGCTTVLSHNFYQLFECAWNVL